MPSETHTQQLRVRRTQEMRVRAPFTPNATRSHCAYGTRIFGKSTRNKCAVFIYIPYARCWEECSPFGGCTPALKSVMPFRRVLLVCSEICLATHSTGSPARRPTRGL